MKIVVLGAGALGSVLAAHLARAGEDVALVARGARAELLRERGVRLAGLVDLTIQVPVVEQPRQLREADLLIVTVKTYDTEPALEGVRHLKVGMAFSVQNGMTKDEQLARCFGAAAILGCVADFSAEVLPDGSVLFTRNEGLYVGELPQATSERVEQVAAVLARAGIKTVISDRIGALELSKLAGWVGLMPISVLTRLRTHLMLLDPDLALLQVLLVREGVSLAEKLGVSVEDVGAMVIPKTLSTLSLEEAVAHVRSSGEQMVARGVTSHKMSALQDLERGRHLEVEETLGYAVRKAEELGLRLPILETCYRLVAGLDRSLG